MIPIPYTAFAVVHYHLKHGGGAGGSLKISCSATFLGGNNVFILLLLVAL